MPVSNTFLIVKRLQRSELGLFDAHRKTGQAKSRQRGLNLDRNVIDLILTPQQQAKGAVEVCVTYRTPSGRVVREPQPRPIKHQAKNWRLTGNKLSEPEFQVLTPGDFILMLFQLDAEFRVYWEAVRVHDSDPAREAVVAYLTEVVGDKTTVLDGASREIVLTQWKALSAPLFTAMPDPTRGKYIQTRLL